MTKAELIYAVTGDVERYLQAIKDDKPDHFPDVGKMAEHIREDTKMIGPTDNTKIEELNVKGLCEIFEGKHTVNPNLAFSTALNKLNEVIRYINK